MLDKLIWLSDIHLKLLDSFQLILFWWQWQSGNKCIKLHKKIISIPLWEKNKVESNQESASKCIKGPKLFLCGKRTKLKAINNCYRQSSTMLHTKKCFFSRETGISCLDHSTACRNCEQWRFFSSWFRQHDGAENGALQPSSAQKQEIKTGKWHHSFNGKDMVF